MSSWHVAGADASPDALRPSLGRAHLEQGAAAGRLRDRGGVAPDITRRFFATAREVLFFQAS
jgi:hypothetical protein